MANENIFRIKKHNPTGYVIYIPKSRHNEEFEDGTLVRVEKVNIQ